MAVSYSMRQATHADAAFLFALNRQTMHDYVCQTWGSWDDAFQTKFFAEHFRPAENHMILMDNEPIGLLSVLRSPERHFVRALQVSIGWQRRGIGTAVMQTLLAEARERGVPLELQVLKVNAPARRLYGRLGFRATAENATHVSMRASSF
ncbi:MAG TPA: GNAT family N-acetyltransferase [Pirellulales bacterium]|nr:GNAT family N-acetyltransferase [Pirellulales bacterium]